MKEFRKFDNDNNFPPSDMAPRRAIIGLKYEGFEERALQVLGGDAIQRALRELERSGVYIADVVVDKFPGRIIANSWGKIFVSGALGSPLANAISKKPQTVGVGEDFNGQLLVSAAMSGVVGFYAPCNESDRRGGRISFLGHDLEDIRHFWLKSFPKKDKSREIYDADDDFDGHLPISEIVPRVYLAKGSFWDIAHFDARTNYALAIREFEKEEIDVVPIEGIINTLCREAAGLIAPNSLTPESIIEFNRIQAAYRLPIKDGIFLLPTSGMAAPLISAWPLSPGRYDPDPFETIMPVVLSNSVAITVPNGYSAEGLPMGLILAGPVELSARLFALAQWFQRKSAWATGCAERTSL